MKKEKQKTAAEIKKQFLQIERQINSGTFKRLSQYSQRQLKKEFEGLTNEYLGSR